MKYNLKNFPTEYPYPCPNVVKWKEGFEKELRKKRKDHYDFLKAFNISVQDPPIQQALGSN